MMVEWTLIGVPVTGETVADIDDNLLTQGVCYRSI